MKELIYIEEPNIQFAHGQKGTDPRDGLSLFGPIEPIYGIKSGVVATKKGLNFFKQYLTKIQSPIFNENNVTRPMFPGFEAVFCAKWEESGIMFFEIQEREITSLLYHSSTYKRTYDLVSLFSNKIIQANKNSDENIDVWFVIVPEDIYKYCRPKSILPSTLVQKKSKISRLQAGNYRYEPALFEDMNIESREKEAEAVAYNYDAQFHNQLKARLLSYNIPTQIIRETTLAWRDFTNRLGKPIRDFSKIEGHLAWTLSTAVFYKAGGKPWKLSDIRSGVCYLGLVYKKIDRSKDNCNACCAAQMFLDNGDGTIFKGELGPWYNPTTKEYHLGVEEAKMLLTQAVDAYRTKNGFNPKEMFIHAKTRFNDIEWNAFQAVVPTETNLVGVTINKREICKLYRMEGEYPVLRGTALILDAQKAFLWTSGFIPHIQTASSMETPNPIFIEIDKGDALIEQVLKDILALTKLNYNACMYGDGIPVTLRFADVIGEILTASIDIITPPLAFKYYI
jgi:hypothetical protein